MCYVLFAVGSECPLLALPAKCAAARQVKTVASREPQMRIYSIVFKGIFQNARTVLAGLGQS